MGGGQHDDGTAKALIWPCMLSSAARSGAHLEHEQLHPAFILRAAGHMPQATVRNGMPQLRNLNV